MRIALFGGTFNPPHKGHVAVVRMLLRHADEVWIMVANRPNKPVSNLCPAKYRFAMAQKAFRSPRVKVRDDEIRRKGASYTSGTLRHLEREYPEHRFVCVIGSDLVPQVKTWNDAANLKKREFWIVFRPYVPIDKNALAFFANARILRGTGVEISSTTLRDGLKRRNRKCATHLLPKAVWLYIKKNRLYANGQ